MNIECLKTNFQSKLSELGNEEKGNIERLNQESRNDEANFAKIRYNVVDIFSQMFHVVLKKQLKYEMIEKEYLTMLDKITLPWREKQKKALQFNDSAAVLIEEIKLGKANEIIQLFNELYRKV